MPSVDVELVKQRNPIERVIASHGVKLRQRGERFVGCCPFHDEQHPSLVVYPSTRSFFCFGCKATGDVIDFVRRKENVGFTRALEMLGEAVPRGVSAKDETRPTVQPESPLTVDDRLVLAAACDLYHEALLRNERALRYLDSRGIAVPVAKQCRLGYSDGQALKPFLRRHRFSLRRATEMGLLRKDGNEALAGRVVIPELRGGQCAWMVGRALSERRLKYLGLSLPKPILGYERVRGHRRVFVAEGAFDYLTGVSWNLPICALLGTHVRAERLRFLERVPEVVLVFDNDDEGQHAARDLAESLGDHARVLRLPDGIKDLGELGASVDGRETFFRLVAELRPAGKEVQHASAS
ncbi:MAG: CHC2 zinc finger domain-containing protein [Dehalococcoidia bacterium]|nr:CHC2 zinc finger domain-containing protein [Dehalococcoidia bacterium]